MKDIPVGAVVALVGVSASAGAAFGSFIYSKLYPSSPPPSVTFGGRELLKIVEAKKKIGIDATKFYNVGVVGTSGVGKSSLINGLCGWDDGDEGAVPTGIIEGPQEVKSYTLPQIPTIQMWDIPGGGTCAHPADTYYEDKCLYAFDCLVIVTASRFTSLDMDIAKQASADKIKVFYVRNRVQIDVENEMRKRKTKLYKETFAIVRGTLDDAYRQVLLDLRAGDVKLHLIDTRAFVDNDLPKHDEQLLQCNIINALPTGRGEQLREEDFLVVSNV